MRYISFLLVVTLLLLLGCSGTQDHVEPKTTSIVINVDIYGNITWSAIPNPMLDLLIEIEYIHPGDSDCKSIWASQDPNGYLVEGHELEGLANCTYRFTAIAPDGYQILGDDFIIHSNVYNGDELEVSFAVIKDD